MEVIKIICIFCGLHIEDQVPVIIENITFAPIWNREEFGKDTITMKYAHINCYRDILMNVAKAAQYASDEKMKEAPIQ